ncbi:hypothetical protein HNQ02_000793 [Flavobacterium sp. 7E]|uniref:hypothetical protein n=1 Tax=Flavobacterium sp. 7E TaxID=2735898 RepID=UPI00156FABAF|nr:hypothetical protein [Flavobacterium sp. 7E]NRS87883.1 hypothetical protein [Flavobacterium sp. 7E]
MKIKKSTATFLLLFATNLLVAVVAFYILPKRFFYDSVIITFDKGNEIGYFGSYPLTILFYKISGLRYLPFPVIALIQYPILVYILYKIGIPTNFEKVNIKNLLVYLGFFMMAIFMSMPSKEFITFIYLAIIVFIYQNQAISFKKSILLSVVLLFVFGAFYRPYFALIPIIAVGMYGVSFVNFKNKTITTLFYGIVIAIFLSLSYGLVKGKFLTESSREVVNSGRTVAQDANSMIVSPLRPDTWYAEAIGIIYGFFSVNVPINGLKHFLSPQIVAFITWQLLLFYILLVRFSKCIKERKKYQYEIAVLLILFAYFIIQGVFEPDLGTAIRHKIGVFPLIYYALYYENFRKELR